MNVLFLGTGEAFDPELPNTSVLIRCGRKAILVDCGFSAAPEFFRQVSDADELQALYLTHMHADHCFGLPALLVWLHEQGRTRPLSLLLCEDRVPAVTTLLERAYPGAAAKLGFPLEFVSVSGDGHTVWQDVELQTARTIHGVPNYAVRFQFPSGRTVMVSGDGEITEASGALLQDADLAIHESYTIDEYRPGHSSVAEVLEMAARKTPKRVALVHTSRRQRNRLAECSGNFFVPRPGTMINF